MSTRSPFDRNGKLRLVFAHDPWWKRLWARLRGEGVWHQLGAMRDDPAPAEQPEGLPPIRPSMQTAEPPAPKPECRGFRWIGQSFAHCEGCGRPYWEHTHDTRMRAGAGPFDDDPFDYVLITDEQKAACKARWDSVR